MQNELIEQKKEIELSLARTILTQIQKGIISFEKGQEMSRYIVDRIESVNTQEKMISFLSDLAKHWDIFSTAFEFYKMRSEEDKQVEDLIKTQQSGV